MAFQLAPLPYAPTALDPYISERTLGFHHGKHHQTYVTNLNNLVKGTPQETASLEEIIKDSAGKADKVAFFNNAGQVWNHDFFWQSMKPKGGGEPTGQIATLIKETFGSLDGFKNEFKTTAVGQFGSGWGWLVIEGGKLKVTKTANADLPLVHGQTAILTCDVWEHAYYLDYQNRRPDFVQAFLDHLVNWDFANANLAKAR